MAAAICCIGFILVTLFSGLNGKWIENSVSRDLITRIEILEKQGKKQGETIAAQTATMTKLKSVVDEQHARIQTQEDIIQDYIERVGKLELTIAELQIRETQHSEDQAQRDNNIQPNSVHDKDDRNKETFNQEKSYTSVKELNPVPKRVEGIRQNRLVASGRPVAFHAVIKAVSVSHIGINQNIVFPDVLTNIGGSYHDLHGIFIAPQPGVYIFSTSVFEYPIRYTNVQIMKNGNTLARAHAMGSSQSQGSVTVVTQLAVGDEVWVSEYNPADASLYGDSYDSFMGCLVTPL